MAIKTPIALAAPLAYFAAGVAGAAAAPIIFS
ncbi:hypothetical protein BH11PSE2_BH11PSE2_22450 [soil metagenome]